MKIFLAGATGAIGRPLVARLVAAGHDVTGTTRSAERAVRIKELGAAPAVLDVLDAAAVRAAVAEAAPDVVMHQLTDLSGEDFAANGRLRIEGTRNLVDAARAAGVDRVIAQSIAWLYVPGDTPAVETDPLNPEARGYEGVVALERTVGELPGGLVLRYGTLYGPGTWYAQDGLIAQRIRSGELVPPALWTSFVHVEDAADAAVQALDWPAGVVNVVDDEPAVDWPQAFGGKVAPGAPTGRPISNGRAKELGWRPAHPTWRTTLGR